MALRYLTSSHTQGCSYKKEISCKITSFSAKWHQPSSKDKEAKYRSPPLHYLSLPPPRIQMSCLLFAKLQCAMLRNEFMHSSLTLPFPRTQTSLKFPHSLFHFPLQHGTYKILLSLTIFAALSLYPSLQGICASSLMCSKCVVKQAKCFFPLLSNKTRWNITASPVSLPYISPVLVLKDDRSAAYTDQHKLLGVEQDALWDIAA